MSSLYGLDDGFFRLCRAQQTALQPRARDGEIKEVFRVLEPAGEFRFSEPHKDCKLFKVLDQIGRDPKRTNRYGKIRRINEYSLAPLLRWSLNEMKTILCEEAGFAKCTYATDDLYIPQPMLICARK